MLSIAQQHARALSRLRTCLSSTREPPVSARSSTRCIVACSSFFGTPKRSSLVAPDAGAAFADNASAEMMSIMVGTNSLQAHNVRHFDAATSTSYLHQTVTQRIHHLQAHGEELCSREQQSE
jgi:hypothetical protein